MGQFYIVVNVETKAYVSLSPNEKLLEHCYQDNEVILAVDKLLQKDGLWYKQPFVWAGFYADDEPGLFVPDDDDDSSSDEKVIMRPANLYTYAKTYGVQLIPSRQPSSSEEESQDEKGNKSYCCRYILNHDKKQFVDVNTVPVDDFGHKIHPLCLLTAEGNGRGGGDYKRRSDRTGLLSDYSLVGIWARNSISVQDSKPTTDFEEFKVKFRCE